MTKKELIFILWKIENNKMLLPQIVDEKEEINLQDSN